jgi:hypothetical protein
MTTVARAPTAAPAKNLNVAAAAAIMERKMEMFSVFGRLKRKS